MRKPKRPAAFWAIILFLGLTLVMVLMGQTMAVFNYDLVVKLGLQESVEEVSEFGVQINRAFGAGDTIIYLPLLAVSLIGLVLRRRWALLSTGAAMAISAYWATVCVFMFLFLHGVDGYHLIPGVKLWTILGTYILAGSWGLLYVVLKGEKLIE